MKSVSEQEFLDSCEDQSKNQFPPRDERRAVELAAYVVRPNKEIIDVSVVDLSYDGCAVRTLQPLVPGEIIKLSVLGQGAAPAVVQWYKSRKAGLLFQAERRSRPRWPRKAERVELEAEAALRRLGRPCYRVRTFDVSPFGCKCEFVERPRIYEHIWIKFDGLESLEAVVCWIEVSKLGLMFMKPVHPAVFGVLLKRLKVGVEAGRTSA